MLAAFQLVQMNLEHIYADPERVQADLKKCKSNPGLTPSGLGDHVEHPGGHLHPPLGQNKRLEQSPR